MDAGISGPPDVGESNFSGIYTSQGMDVKFCRRQHEVLVKHLRRVLESLGHYEVEHHTSGVLIDDTSRLCFPSLPMQASRELELVLTRAKSLSQDCNCSELTPVTAALKQAQWSQAFADILKEIQWCTSVLYYDNISRNVEVPSIDLKDFPWQARMGYQEQFLLEKAAEEDWQELMVELENWNQDHLCSAENCGNMHVQGGPRCCLATQILGRWNEAKLGHVVAGDDVSPSGKGDHQSLLWSFDKEVLNHGRPLGSGAFGSVSEARWLGAKYAHKIFNVTGLSSLPAEAGALAKMNHPHIVKVLAYSEDSLLMHLMCTDLQKYILSRMKGGARAQPVSLSAAIDLMLQVADAVSYLHSRKMAHRDLKSLNILVDLVDTPGLLEEGYVFARIADFGLAKTKREITRYSHLTHDVGTRRWMAPEIFGANKEDSHLADAFPMKADVYSFGIVCFEILSGELPFNDVLASDLYKKLTAPIPLRPRLPSTCPTILASLICACWDGDPQKRPAFTDVCRVLRYLKGLLLTGLNDTKLVPRDGEWPFGILTTGMVKKQGPWGWQEQKAQQYFKWMGWCQINFSYLYNREHRVESYHIGPSVDIRAIKLHSLDPDPEPENFRLVGFQVAFDISGELVERRVGGDYKASTDWIKFDHPSEFLVQVEGSSSSNLLDYKFFFYPASCIIPSYLTSLTFITNRQKYGPYGTFTPWNAFSSDPGRVVGFTGYHSSNHTIHSLEVHVVPDITECVHSCLETYYGEQV